MSLKEKNESIAKIWCICLLIKFIELGYNNKIILLSRSLEMKQFNWSQDEPQAIMKVPLLFTFPPVEALMKELTKLNSNHPYRIAYLGPRWGDSLTFHKKYSANGQYLFD